MTGGTWSAANGVAASPGSGSTQFLYRSNSDAHLETQYSYRNTQSSGYLVLRLRYLTASPHRRIELIMGLNTHYLREWNGSSWTTLVQNNNETTSQNVWYNIRIVADGSTIKVWRGVKGEAMQEILSTTSASLTSTNRFEFYTPAGNKFEIDNIRIVSDWPAPCNLVHGL